MSGRKGMQRPEQRLNLKVTKKGKALVAQMKLEGTVPIADLKEEVPQEFISKLHPTRVDVDKLLAAYKALL